MNPAQLELFDEAVLRVLDTNRTRFGLGVDALAHHLRLFGFPSPDREIVLDRLDYLAGKGHVQEVEKVANKASRAWRITEAGINRLDR